MNKVYSVRAADRPTSSLAYRLLVCWRLITCSSLIFGRQSVSLLISISVGCIRFSSNCGGAL